MDLKQYHEITAAAWKFFRRWAEAPAVDWDAAIEQANAAVEECRGQQVETFAAETYTVMIRELERLKAGDKP